MTLKWKFIVNPNAGSQKCIKRWEVAEPVLKQSGIEHDVVFTTGPDEGIKLVHKAVAEGFDRIVVASGDGVVNEAINGLMTLHEEKRKQVAFGVLPFGTGNDYNTVLGIPWNPEKAIKTLLEKSAVAPVSTGKFKMLDTGLEYYFGNVFDMGISSLVCFATKKGEMSWIKGPKKYTFLALKKLITVKQRKGWIRLDDGEQIDFKLMLVAIGVGKAIGGGMLACVEAHPQADYFNVFITQKFTKFQTLIGINKIFVGKHKDMKNAFFANAKKVEVKLESPIGMEYDGELHVPQAISSHVVVEIIPKAINVLYNIEHPSIYWLTKEEVEKGKKPKIDEDKEKTHNQARKMQEKGLLI